MPVITNTQARHKLIADIRFNHQSSTYEASLPLLGLSAVGVTKEQAVGRLGTSLSMLFDDANR